MFENHMTKFLLWLKIIWAALSSRSNQAFYDKISSFYNDVYTGHEVHAKKIMSMLNDIYAGNENKTLVLDLGCGTGMMTRSLSQQGYKVIGADISFDSLNVHKKHYPDHTLIQADANFLPVADDTFDSVVCLGVWRHFPDVQKVLDEVSRVLRNDGTFIVGYFPPAMAGSIDLHQKWWGKVLIRFYQFITKAFGYVDRADFSLEEETIEFAKKKFKSVKSVDSADHKSILIAQNPLKSLDDNHHIPPKNQEINIADLDNVLQCPYCIMQHRTTGQLKMIGKKWFRCKEPECGLHYPIRNKIPILLKEDGVESMDTAIS